MERYGGVSSPESAAEVESPGARPGTEVPARRGSFALNVTDRPGWCFGPRLAGGLDKGLAQGLILVWPGFSVPLTPRLPSLIPVKTVRLGCTAWWTR